MSCSHGQCKDKSENFSFYIRPDICCTVTILQWETKTRFKTEISWRPVGFSFKSQQAWTRRWAKFQHQIAYSAVWNVFSPLGKCLLFSALLLAPRTVLVMNSDLRYNLGKVQKVCNFNSSRRERESQKKIVVAVTLDIDIKMLSKLVKSNKQNAFYYGNVNSCMKYTNLLQRPGGMEGCDVITSRQHFEEGVPALTGKEREKKRWSFCQQLISPVWFLLRHLCKSLLNKESYCAPTFLQAVWKHSWLSLLIPLGSVWLRLQRGPGGGSYSEPRQSDYTGETKYSKQNQQQDRNCTSWSRLWRNSFI